MEDDNNIKVFIRIKPNLQIGSSSIEDSKSILKFYDENRIIINNPERKNYLPENEQRENQFQFDTIFGPNSEQLEIFVQTIPYIDAVLEGRNSTIFCYGISGSGKTYTILGNKNINIRQLTNIENINPECGIFPRSLQYIFNKTKNKKTSLYLSSIELYNNQYRNLLLGYNYSDEIANKIKYLNPLEKSIDYSNMHYQYVKPLTDSIINQTQVNLERIEIMSNNSIKIDESLFKPISTIYDGFYLLSQSSKHRVTRSTEMNLQSSRSHWIITIYIIEEERNEYKIGKLRFVDLAGSENMNNTSISSSNEHEKRNIELERKSIQMSLYNLRNVLYQLSINNSSIPSYIYRDKLLYPLRDSLGGDNKTLMITTIPIETTYYSLVYQTLDYSKKAKLIKNMNYIDKCEEEKCENENGSLIELEVLRRQNEELKIRCEILQQQILSVNAPIRLLPTDKNNSFVIENEQFIQDYKKDDNFKSPHYLINSYDNSDIASLITTPTLPFTNSTNLSSINLSPSLIYEEPEKDSILEVENQELKESLTEARSAYINLSEKYRILQQQSYNVVQFNENVNMLNEDIESRRINNNVEKKKYPNSLIGQSDLLESMIIDISQSLGDEENPIIEMENTIEKQNKKISEYEERFNNTEENYKFSFTSINRENGLDPPLDLSYDNISNEITPMNTVELPGNDWIFQDLCLSLYEKTVEELKALNYSKNEKIEILEEELKIERKQRMELENHILEWNPVQKVEEILKKDKQRNERRVSFSNQVIVIGEDYQETIDCYKIKDLKDEIENLIEQLKEMETKEKYSLDQSEKYLREFNECCIELETQDRIIESLQKRNNELTSKMIDRDSSIEELRKENKSFLREIERIQEMRREEETVEELNLQQRKIMEMKETIKKLERELKDKDNDRAEVKNSYNSIINQLNNELDEYNNEIEIQAKRNAIIENKNNKLLGFLEVKDKKIEDLNEKYRKLKNDREEIEERCNLLKKEVESSRSEKMLITELNGEIKESEVLMAQLKMENIKLKSKLNQFKENNERYLQKEDELKSEIKELKILNRSHEKSDTKRIKEFEENYKSTEKDFKTMDMVISTLQEQLSNQKLVNKNLLEDIKEMENNIEIKNESKKSEIELIKYNFKEFKNRYESYLDSIENNIDPIINQYNIIKEEYRIIKNKYKEALKEIHELRTNYKLQKEKDQIRLNQGIKYKEKLKKIDDLLEEKEVKINDLNMKLERAIGENKNKEKENSKLRTSLNRNVLLLNSRNAEIEEMSKRIKYNSEAVDNLQRNRGVLSELEEEDDRKERNMKKNDFELREKSEIINELSMNIIDLKLRLKEKEDIIENLINDNDMKSRLKEADNLINVLNKKNEEMKKNLESIEFKLEEKDSLIRELGKNRNEDQEKLKSDIKILNDVNLKYRNQITEYIEIIQKNKNKTKSLRVIYSPMISFNGRNTGILLLEKDKEISLLKGRDKSLQVIENKPINQNFYSMVDREMDDKIIRQNDKLKEIKNELIEILKRNIEKEELDKFNEIFMNESETKIFDRNGLLIKNISYMSLMIENIIELKDSEIEKMQVSLTHERSSRDSATKENRELKLVIKELNKEKLDLVNEKEKNCRKIEEKLNEISKLEEKIKILNIKEYELSSKLKRAKESTEEKEKELENIRSSYHEMKENIEEMNNDYEKIIKQQKEEIDEGKRSNSKLENEIKELSVNSKNQNETITELQIELNKYKEIIRIEKDKLEQIKTDRANITESFSTIKEEMKNRLDGMIKTYEYVQMELNRAKLEINRINEINKDLIYKIGDIEKEKSSEIEKGIVKIKELNKEIDKINKKIEAKECALRNYQSEKLEEKTEMNNLQKQIEIKKMELEKLERENQRLKLENDLNTKNYKRILEELQEKNEEIQQELNKKDKENIDISLENSRNSKTINTLNCQLLKANETMKEMKSNEIKITNKMNKEIEDIIEKYDTEIEKLKNRNIKLENQIKEIDNQVKMKNLNVKEKDEMLTEIAVQITDLQVELNRERNEEQKLMNINIDLSKKLQDLSQIIREMKGIEEEYNSLKIEKERQDSEIKILNEVLEKISNKNSEVMESITEFKVKAKIEESNLNGKTKQLEEYLESAINEKKKLLEEIEDVNEEMKDRDIRIQNYTREIEIHKLLQKECDDMKVERKELLETIKSNEKDKIENMNLKNKLEKMCKMMLLLNDLNKKERIKVIEKEENEIKIRTKEEIERKNIEEINRILSSIVVDESSVIYKNKHQDIIKKLYILQDIIKTNKKSIIELTDEMKMSNNQLEINRQINKTLTDTITDQNKLLEKYKENNSNLLLMKSRNKDLEEIKEKYEKEAVQRRSRKLTKNQSEVLSVENNELTKSYEMIALLIHDINEVKNVLSTFSTPAISPNSSNSYSSERPKQESEINTLADYINKTLSYIQERNEYIEELLNAVYDLSSCLILIENDNKRLEIERNTIINSSSYNKILGRITKLEKENYILKQRNNELEELQNENKRMVEELKENEIVKFELNNRVKELEIENREVKFDHELLKKEIEILSKEKSQIACKLNEAVIEKNKLQEDLVIMETEMKITQDNNKKIENRLKESLDKLNEEFLTSIGISEKNSTIIIEELNKKIYLLENQIQEISHFKEDEDKKFLELNSDLKDEKNKSNELRDQKEKMEIKLTEEINKIKEIKEQLEEENKRNQELKDQKEKMEIKLTEEINKIKEREEELQRIIEEMKNKNNIELEEIKEEYRELTRKENEKNENNIELLIKQNKTLQDTIGELLEEKENDRKGMEEIIKVVDGNKSEKEKRELEIKNIELNRIIELLQRDLIMNREEIEIKENNVNRLSEDIELEKLNCELVKVEKEKEIIKLRQENNERLNNIEEEKLKVEKELKKFILENELLSYGILMIENQNDYENRINGEMKNTNKNLKERAEKAENKIKSLEEFYKSKSRENDERISEINLNNSAEIETLSRKINNHLSVIESLSKELLLKDESIRVLKDKLVENENRLNEAKMKQNQSEDEMEKLKTRFENKVEGLTKEFNDSINNYNSQLKILHTTGNNAIESLKSENQFLQLKVENKEKEMNIKLEEMRVEIQNLIDENKFMLNKMDESTKEMFSLNKIIKEKEREREKLLERINNLINIGLNNENEIKSLLNERNAILDDREMKINKLIAENESLTYELIMQENKLKECKEINNRIIQKYNALKIDYKRNRELMKKIMENNEEKLREVINECENAQLKDLEEKTNKINSLINQNELLKREVMNRESEIKIMKEKLKELESINQNNEILKYDLLREERRNIEIKEEQIIKMRDQIELEKKDLKNKIVDLLKSNNELTEELSNERIMRKKNEIRLQEQNSEVQKINEYIGNELINNKNKINSLIQQKNIEIDNLKDEISRIKNKKIQKNINQIATKNLRNENKGQISIETQSIVYKEKPEMVDRGVQYSIYLTYIPSYEDTYTNETQIIS